MNLLEFFVAVPRLPFASAAGLILLAIACGFTDWKYSKVYNVVTIPCMAAGIAVWGVAAGWSGASRAASGLLIGAGLFLVPYLQGGVGAGDVKMFGAVGALGGWPFVLLAVAYSILIGGAMASWVLWRRGRFLATLKKICLIALTVVFRRLGALTPEEDPDAANRLTIPMGLAISVGTMAALADHIWHWGIL